MRRSRSRTGNATLSKTVIESNRAAPWNTIPKTRRASVSARPPSAEISMPSTWTVPLSGLRSPMTCLRSTVLPDPDAPRTT